MQQEYTNVILPSIKGSRVAILQSKWYSKETDAMIAPCVELLRSAGCEIVDHYILPGSLELPLAARRVARMGRNYDALVVFGVIVKGETYHFEVVMNECTRGLSQVMMEEDLPIISEILPVTSLAQVEARSRPDSFNKGIEAAQAAAEIIDWRRRHPAARGAI